MKALSVGNLRKVHHKFKVFGLCRVLLEVFGWQPNRRRLGVYVNRFATYDCLPLDQSSSDLGALDWYKTDKFLEQLFSCLLT